MKKYYLENYYAYTIGSSKTVYKLIGVEENEYFKK